MFIHSWLSLASVIPFSLQENALMTIYCLRQHWEVLTSSCKVFDSTQILVFATDFHKVPSVSFTESRPVGAALIHADRRTSGMLEVIGLCTTVRTCWKAFCHRRCSRIVHVYFRSPLHFALIPALKRNYYIDNFSCWSAMWLQNSPPFAVPALIFTKFSNTHCLDIGDMSTTYFHNIHFWTRAVL